MPTPIDTARLAEQNQERLVPEGPAPTGSFVAVTGQMPFQYGWSQPPPSRVLEYHGNPDGELNASKGALCTDIDTPDVYQNQDGADSWALVGSGGSGFPVGPEDDGTGTHEIETRVLGSVAQMYLHTEDSADPTAYASYETDVIPGAVQATISEAHNPNGSMARVQTEAAIGAGTEASLLAFDASANFTRVVAAQSAGAFTVGIGGAGAEVTCALNGDTLGFYGTTPVAQAGTPTTLGDVITILQDLGLCS